MLNKHNCYDNRYITKSPILAIDVFISTYIVLLWFNLFAISLVVVKSVRAMMVSFEIGASDNAHGMSGMLLAA